jgi:hypothetical protein
MNTPNLFDGPFTLAMANSAGFTPHRVRRLVADGAVRRVVRGVYVDASRADTILLRAQAAALLVSPTTVLCDRTAAWLHGIDVFRWPEHDLLPPLDSFVLRHHSRHSRAGLYGGQRDLLESDVMVVHGVRVTTPLRTALDLGCALSRRDALAALDAFMRLHGLTQKDLLAELPRYFRRRGVRQLRGLVPLADPRSESPGESWTRMEIIDSNLPLPQLQWCVMRGGRVLFRLDLAFPGLKIAIEYDGEEFHDSTETRQADERRRRWLEEHGWIVIVVRRDGFTTDGLARWTEQLRRAIEMRQVTVRLRPGHRRSA